MLTRGTRCEYPIMPRQMSGTRGRRPPRGESSGWEDVDDDWGPTVGNPPAGRGKGRPRGRHTTFLLPQGSGAPFSDGIRRYQELLREERQKRRWQQPRLGTITATDARGEPEESSDEERLGGGQKAAAQELTSGGCSGNASRPSVSTPTVATQPVSSSASGAVMEGWRDVGYRPSVFSSSSAVAAGEERRESGREYRPSVPSSSTMLVAAEEQREPGREYRPSISSSASMMGAMEERREIGRESVQVQKEKEAEAVWWEGSETQGVPVFGWFFRGTEGGELVAAYLADGQAKLLGSARYREGVQRARRHLLGEEGEPPAQHTVNVPASVQLGAKRYLSEYARERKTLPRQEAWARVLSGEKDHRGETVAAEFYCQRCSRRRRVPVRWANGLEEASRGGRRYVNVSWVGRATTGDLHGSLGSGESGESVRQETATGCSNRCERRKPRWEGRGL